MIPANIYKGSYADEAAINAEYVTGEPGWNAYNEDTATFWTWTSGAWVDSGSALAVSDSPARYSGFEHVFDDAASLVYDESANNQPV